SGSQSISLTNTTFDAPGGQPVLLEGNGTVALTHSIFEAWNGHAITANAGTMQASGNTFAAASPAILLDSGVHSAVVMSNDFDDPGTAVTDNTAGSAELEIDLATGGPADLPAAPDLTSAALPVDRFP